MFISILFTFILLFINDINGMYNFIPFNTSDCKPITNNRTAIILSGQIRSGNITWSSGKLKYEKSTLMFGPDDPQTPIQTMLEWFIKPIALYGGVDMFIYIQVDRNLSSIEWDGDPATYEPTINDYGICDIYTNHSIFYPETGNKIFCLNEYEKDLLNPFIEKYDFWSEHILLRQSYDRWTATEILLQQLYGLYRANTAAKEYALSNNIKYTYKVRLRPDTAIVKPLPLSLGEIKFSDDKCKGIIYFPLTMFYIFGSQDSFNIGLADDMDIVLDRYVDLTTKPFKYRPWGNHGFWSSESYLYALLEERYSLCLNEMNDLWVVLIHKNGFEKNRHKEPVIVKEGYFHLRNPNRK